MQLRVITNCIGLGLLLAAAFLGCRRMPEKEIPAAQLAERSEALAVVEEKLELLQTSEPDTAINLADHGDFRVRRTAARRIVELQLTTPEALAALSALLKDEHPRVRSAAMNALLELNLTESIPSIIPLLVDSESSVRVRAQKTLKRFGTDGMEALIQIMSDPAALETQYYEDLRKKKVVLSHRVFDTLATAGSLAVDPTIRALKHEERHIRTAAPLILARIGEPASSAIDPLLEILDGDDQEMRATCARALGAFGRHDRVVTRLQELTEDSEETVAKGAREGLATMSRQELEAQRRRELFERKREKARKRRENAKKVYDGRKIKSE